MSDTLDHRHTCPFCGNDCCANKPAKDCAICKECGDELRDRRNA